MHYLHIHCIYCVLYKCHNGMCEMKFEYVVVVVVASVA
jgi:hypothetical protein